MLIVLHCNGNGHEATLDADVVRMGARYGNVYHVTQEKNLQFEAPATTDTDIHILAHGKATAVADISTTTFKTWIVNAFKLTWNLDRRQNFFIYSCDVALGGANLLSDVAQHVAGLHIKNRTFIGTAGENAVIKSGQGLGKILVQWKGTQRTQTLGQGWKAYRTSQVGRNSKHVRAFKLKGTDVSALVRNAMNW